MKRSKHVVLIERSLTAIFRSGEEPWNGLAWVWFLGIVFLGLAAWGFVLSWGDIAFDVHDWVQEGPRYDFLRRSILQWRLPLHIGTTLTETTRFLAIPDTVISPQVLLLRWITPGSFVLLNAILLYLLGALGFLILAQKLAWSAFATTAGWVLFALNGHITAQVAVGHSMWLSYFLLPYFLLLMLRLFEGRVGWRWILGDALLGFALLLNGGYHFFIWIAMFQLALVVFRSSMWRPVLVGLVAAILLSLIRLLPAAIQYWGADRAFMGGYPSIMDLLDAITVLKYPGSINLETGLSIGWWELDAYMGLLGILFLVVFGLVFKSGSKYKALLWPAFLMLILAMGRLYQPVTMLPIPLVGAERVSSRFIILPLVILILLGTQGFELWQRRYLQDFSSQAIALAVWGLMTNDLLQHARMWRVENMTLLFPRTPVDIRTKLLAIEDPGYELALLIGAVVSGLSLLVLLFLAWREGKRSQG